MKILLRTVVTSILLFSSSLVFAGYNANFKGKITQVLTYTYSTQILIRVEGQPSDHPECNLTDYLSVDPDISAESRQLVYSRILTAYATGEVVNIGYDKTGGCVSGRIRIYRVG